jgi:U6 snRNA-associated Sm-like protein LSm6
MQRKTPESFLKQVFGREVLIKLTSGPCYTGVLASMDALMNIVLENAEERLQDEVVNKFGYLFLRGNNGMRIDLLGSFVYQAETQRYLTYLLVQKKFYLRKIYFRVFYIEKI